ncbi:MAG: galactose mutarotase [Actinobacteria bacterium]|nr:galactose mutarotase [Actinomycetota bacterium]
MQRIVGDHITVEVDLNRGGRVSSVKWKDLEFALPYRDDPMAWGWFAMVPWAGRIDRGFIKDAAGTEFALPTHWDPPHAEHGYGFVSSWESTSPNTSRLELPAPYAPAYAEQTIELSGNTIRWSLNYFAKGCTLPAWVGFHPWLPRRIDNHEYELIFTPGKMLLRGKDGIPTGDLVDIPPQPWDDAFFGVTKFPVVRWGNIAQIEIASSVPWWVVYSEDPLAICVEPQTAPPDAANLGISGAHSIRATFTFS